jgi:hypothetical protein
VASSSMIGDTPFEKTGAPELQRRPQVNAAARA